jgi:hypothetical protein
MLRALQKIPNWVVCSGLAFVALAAYFTVLPGYFLSDDAMIAALFSDTGQVNWAHVARTFAADWRCYTGPEVMYFRPLVVVTEAIDAQLWGLSPVGYHLTNVAWHAVVGFALWRVALRLGAAPFAALFAAFLFTVHPLHAESVTWISGRTDLVAAAPTLGSIAAFLAYRQSGRGRLLLGSLMLYALALLSKEPAVGTPLMIAALDLGLPRHPPERSRDALTLKPLLAFGAMTFLYLAWRKRVLGDVFGGVGHNFYKAPEGNLTRLWNYLRDDFGLFLFPFNRHIGDQDALAWGSSIVLLALALTIVANLMSGVLPLRRLAVVVLVFFASIAPIASAMGINEDLTGSRMWYLPSAWLCMLIAMSCVQQPRPWSFGVAVGTLGALVMILRANLVPWVDAGDTIRNVRDIYAKTFGSYAGETIRDLPRVDRGAYLALWNAELFRKPFVQEAPRPDQQARLDAIYRADARTIEILPAEAWRATERLDRDLQSAVWLFDPAAPLEPTWLENCQALERSSEHATFEARNNDPWITFAMERDIASPEASGLRETAYLLIAPAPSNPPELFWLRAAGEHWSGDRFVALQLELTVAGGRAVPRVQDGYAMYSARLDTHPLWPGVHAVRGLRLDPTANAGRFSIRYFNVSRELRSVR